MFNVIYRWTIHPGAEADFEHAWAEMTRLVRTYRGGLGSRLHRCSDGTFLAYAQWPDRATWERARTIALPENTAAARMKAAIVASEPPLEMTQLQDLFS